MRRKRKTAVLRVKKCPHKKTLCKGIYTLIPGVFALSNQKQVCDIKALIILESTKQ